jgi:hypothetical protein
VMCEYHIVSYYASVATYIMNSALLIILMFNYVSTDREAPFSQI